IIFKPNRRIFPEINKAATIAGDSLDLFHVNRWPCRNWRSTGLTGLPCCGLASFNRALDLTGLDRFSVGRCLQERDDFIRVAVRMQHASDTVQPQVESAAAPWRGRQQFTYELRQRYDVSAVHDGLHPLRAHAQSSSVSGCVSEGCFFTMRWASRATSVRIFGSARITARAL